MKKLLLLSLSLILAVPAVVYADLNPLLKSRMQQEKRKVVDIVSSNMIALEGGDKVRLIGLKEIVVPRTKEIKRDKHGFVVHDTDDPRWKLEEQAGRFMKDLLLGEKVTLKFDAERRNQDGFLEAYVYLPDGQLANDVILRQGYADLQLRPPNMKHAKQLREAYREAANEQRGIQGQW